MLNPDAWNEKFTKHTETIASLVNMPLLKQYLKATDVYLKLQVTEPNDNVPHFELNVFGSKSIITWEDPVEANKYFSSHNRWNEMHPKTIKKIVTDQRLLTIFRIGFQHYPHCCAFIQANGFQYNDTFGSKELCYFLMDTLSKELVATFSPWSKRLMFNFVEPGYKRIEGQCKLRDRKDRFLAEIPTTDKPVIQYPHIWNWAKEQHAFRELVNYNENSGNIVHTVTIVPKVNF